MRASVLYHARTTASCDYESNTLSTSRVLSLPLSRPRAVNLKLVAVIVLEALPPLEVGPLG